MTKGTTLRGAHLVAAGAIAGALAGQPLTGCAEDLTARPGIHCARGAAAISPASRRDLVGSLRRLTGLAGLDFDDQGVLSLGDRAAPHGGSPTARLVLDAALESGMAFVVEDHSGSGQVAFGQLDAGTNVADVGRGEDRLLWRVRIDFKDLAHFAAPAPVRAAFDPGFALLHEILHGLGFPDTKEAEEIGAVEEILNRARGELGLPLRDRYLAEGRLVAEALLSVRIRFRTPAAPDGPPRDRYEYLTFLMDARQAPWAERAGLISACCLPGQRWMPRN
jgi:hypothetical protein